MQKIIFGIFAHPDDEAFGPAGALLKETRGGTKLHLICLTPGDAGTNPDNAPDLGTVREREWREAGQLLGAQSMHLLGYRDSHLDNTTMIEAASRIETIIKQTVDANEAAEIECMSLDLNGYTGHIDHIVAARAACLAFYRLKQHDTRFKRIRFACLPRTIVPTANTDWIYMEAGRNNNEIDETVDARSMRDDIITVMNAHHSQRNDRDANIKAQGENLGLVHFIVKS